MAATTPVPLPALETYRTRALTAAGVGLLACALGLVLDRDHFFRSWLIAYLLFLGIALGSMGLMMIQHLSGGAWGVFRRIFEAASSTLPLMALLFIPVVAGMGTLYPWTHLDHVAEDEVLGRTGGIYGDWFNFYACDITIQTFGLQPGGPTRTVRITSQPTGRCTPQ